MSDDCTSLDQGGIRFYDNVVPSLGVGDFLLNVTQQINPSGSDIDECYSASQAFSVQGPRYTLPPEDVYSIFPPDNAQGIFDQFLPHVVFTQRELPWERNVFTDTDPATQTPWLALLLFVEGEQIGGADALLAPQVTGWTPNSTMSATIPAASFYADNAGDGILWPGLVQEWYESSDWLQATQCQVIDVSPQAFAALVPGKTELRYLAHARQVDPSAKDESVLQMGADGWYSVLVAGRLPDAPPAGTTDAGRRNIVHLVSLEGLEQYVAGTALPSGTTRVRMISLESWSYTCLPELGESFTALMDGLLTDSAGNEKSTTFTVPVDPAAPPSDEVTYAAAALGTGYVPLQWQTRLGEQSFAWYRGPFSAAPVTSFVAPAQDGTGGVWFGTASAAAIYDPTYGVFDVSYAVAWETGRLLALSDAKFGQELLAWQRIAHRVTDRILERQAQLASLSSLDAEGNAKEAQPALEAVKRYALTGDVMTHLVRSFDETIGCALRDAPPAGGAPPSTPWPDAAPAPGGSLAVTAASQSGEIRDAIAEAASDSLQAIASWLGDRYLLKGVPFEALVPNEGLLPAESVRFFYVDDNWLDALLEGALSIGVESSRDGMVQQLMAGEIWSGTTAAAAQSRSALLAKSAPRSKAAQAPPAPPSAPRAGLLLRSAAVSGWPGLEAHAFASFTVDASGAVQPDLDSEISALRLDLLSDDVLIALWPQVPALVTLDEPHEGIAFGFEDPPVAQGEGDWLYLRSLGSSDYGMPCCTDAEMEGGTCAYAIDAVADALFDPTTRRLNFDTLVSSIETKLGVSALQVRDFAVEMVKVPEQAVFATPPPPPTG